MKDSNYTKDLNLRLGTLFISKDSAESPHQAQIRLRSLIVRLKLGGTPYI